MSDNSSDIKTAHSPSPTGRVLTSLRTPTSDLSYCRHEGAATAPQWYAVYTRSRHEKLVHRALLDRGVESFLPLHEVLSRWKDRWQRIQRPLFPGYLFVHMIRPHLGAVRQTRGVVYVVGSGGQPAAVPDSQVEAVRGVVQKRLAVRACPCPRRGQRVRVRRGPLAGTQGLVVKQKNRWCLVMTVDLLGQSVATEIDLDCVEEL